MKNKTLFDSIRCALNGLKYAINTEKNYKYYFFIAFTFLIINIIMKVGVYGHLAYVITTVGVFASESINTAVEHFVDMYTSEISDEVKIIKDIAAATVLCFGIGFFACEIIMIGNKLI